VLRYTVRRLLWSIPTLFGLSIVVFLLTTLLPEPRLPDAAQQLAITTGDFDTLDRLVAERRARFLQLPRFMNPRPQDVRTLAASAVVRLESASLDSPIAAHQLARLGGAALPHVLPHLDGMSPGARGRVAVALAPVAERMGMGVPEELRVPEKAALFWTRFWEDRSLDFTEPAVRRAVRRLTHFGTDFREEDVVQADTFALEETIMALAATRDRVAIERLTRVAARVASRGAVATLEMSDVERRRIVRDWQEWWYVYGTDFIVLSGPERVASTLAETRYGKWASRVASGRLGVSARDQEPIERKVRARAGVTLLVTAASMFLSFALAVPIGAFSAWRRGRAVDVLLAVALFALYSTPTFWTATLLAQLAPPGAAARLPLAIASLTLGSLAVLSRQQRSAMLEVVGQDYVRTARAKGVSATRVLLVHALRNAMVPTVTLASLQLPTLLGGAFVVEEVFGLQGVGFETLRAVEQHDAPWLMAIVLLCALLVTVALILSDIAHAALDPRVRETIARRTGAST